MVVTAAEAESHCHLQLAVTEGVCVRGARHTCGAMSRILRDRRGAWCHEYAMVCSLTSLANVGSMTIPVSSRPRAAYVGRAWCLVDSSLRVFWLGELQLCYMLTAGATWMERSQRAQSNLNSFH